MGGELRVLLVAPDDGRTATWIQKALAGLGHKSLIYDYRKMAANIGAERMNAQVVALAGESYDLVLGLKAELVDPHTWAGITMKRTTAVWNFDPRHGQDSWVLDIARNVDHFFTIGKGLVAGYHENGINAHWLLEAADPQTHFPVAVRAGAQIFPLSFVGTVENVPGREKWLAAVRDAFPTMFHLFGSFPGTLRGLHYHGRAEEYAEHHLKRRFHGDDALNLVVSHSTVNLGRDRNPEIAKSYGARLFRTLAAGGFLLTNHTIGIEEDFAGCVGIYNDDDECIKLIRHYLESGKVRKDRAERGRALVLAKHTWTHRTTELLKAVGLG